ncbi:T9SS type A sorting domain-containing protein [Coprobacter sp.]
MTGGLVSEGTGTLNLSKLPSGNYIAKVKTDNGVRTIKFIKK